MRRLIRALLAFAPLLLASCGTDLEAPSDARPPNQEIRDGAHLGNAHFFFLPPMQPKPSYFGISDGALSPAVSICEWSTFRNACGLVIAEFATGGSGTPRISYDIMGEKYQVDWKTDQCLTGACVLNPAKTYRIRVMVGATELGHADVDVVATGAELRNVTTSDFIGLVDGRTMPLKFRIEKGAVSVLAPGGSAPVGVAGGAVTTADGSVSMTFPEGALSSNTNISVTPVTNPPEGTGAWAPTVDLGPNGSTFATPVTLTLGYKPENLPPGIPPSALVLMTFDGTGWAPVEGSTIDSVDNTISAPISHFSGYSLGIWPNAVNGMPPSTIRVGQQTTLGGSVWYYNVVPTTYCYSVRAGWYGRTTVCNTYTNTYTWPTGNAAVYWSSLSPFVATMSGGPSYTDASGYTTSPPITGLHPGAATVFATSYGRSSTTTNLTVQGVLGLLPRTARNVAGWSIGERITQSVAIPSDLSVSLRNVNGFLTVGESGTSNYTYGGHTGTYVLPTGTISKTLVVAGLSGVGVDTLIASASGFLPDTAIITLVKGYFRVSGVPATLAFGDSAAVQVTVVDSAGALGNLAYPITVALGGGPGLSFSDGHAAITTIGVPQRTSPTFYVRGTDAGAQVLALSHPDYVTYTSPTVDVSAPPQPPAPLAPGPQVISGGKSTCELPLTGPVFCWGEPSYGATTATSSAFSTLGGGGFQYCGIKTDQQLECWGHNGDNRATPPGGLFRQISVSAEDACALRADGTAACWGFTADGRASVPPGSYTRISLGWYHGCAIRPDATLVCWGRPQSGEEIHPPANERFREIAANASATCGIRSGYTLVCFGGSPTPPSGYFIALGPSVGGHMCAIAFDRSLACWGQNDFGQADPPAGQFIQVSEGLWHSCAVKTDHSVVCWGSNATGATTVGQPPPPAPAFTLIVVQPNPAGVGPGQAVQLTAAAFDVAHNPVAAFAPTWTSADTHVATVDGHGIVTGVANGTAVVTASSNGVSGSSTVSVGQPIINPFPQAPQQFILQVLPGVPGTGISAIGNAGTGILTGLQVLNVPGNCGTNPAGSWLSFAFDGTTAPTNLRVTATVPTGTPYGVYDCVFTLAGSGAPNRPHGIRVSVQEVVVSNPPWIDPFPQAGSQNVIDVSAGGTTVKNVPVGNPGGGTLSGLTFVEPIRNCATGAPVTWLTYAWQSTTAPTTLILTASPPMTTTPGQYDLCFELRARAVGAMDRSYGARVNVGPVVGPTGPWDAAADFSETNNPTGQWSSGWTTTLGSLFAIYDVHERQDGDVLAAWRDSFFNQFGTITPTFQKNISIASVVYGIAPGQVSLHSGCAHGELGVLRWTAPAAGTYTIHATFFAGNSGNTDAYVLLDGNGGQPLLAAPTTNVQPSYAGTLTLLFGQTIDFVVGTGGDGCGSDSTPFVATIQRQ